VIPLVTSHAPMLGRTLLYTAITRARRLPVIVGQKNALYLAVRDWRRRPATRRSAGRRTGRGGSGGGGAWLARRPGT
jgi:exodeoxyribonuclease V alpha subunit